jgi:transcriptional antiterminator Rof (Rho-off)
MFDKTIEDLVNEYVKFDYGLNSKGWSRCYCEVCGDGSRTKGPRGGWLFSGEMAFYHCFNQGCEGNFDPNRDQPFSKNMVEILNAFGIPSKEYFAVAYAKKILDPDNKSKKPERVKVDTPILPVPDYFYDLSECDPEGAIVQRAYAELKFRGIDPESQTFYLSSGKSAEGPKADAIAKTLVNRLIIPFYNKDGEMIYYQARALDKNAKKKYINADVPRTNIIYGMDKLNINLTQPLFVTEGFFDAQHLKGVSVQENSMTAGQIELLKRSPRAKVFVPDKGSDSSKMVDQFVKLGWKISVPDIGSSCKDVDDAIRRYGKLYVLQQIGSNIYNAEDAKIMLSLNGFLVNSR